MTAMHWTGLIAATLCVTGPAHAQVVPGLPRVGGVVDRVTGALPDVGEPLGDARSLVRAQTERIRELVRRHPTGWRLIRMAMRCARTSWSSSTPTTR
jgi:hypothetical protein